MKFNAPALNERRVLRRMPDGEIYDIGKQTF
jgi:hypothetical protein